MCDPYIQYYSHHVWNFHNNTLAIMQNTAFLIWKGQNRKSQKMVFWLKIISKSLRFSEAI